MLLLKSNNKNTLSFVFITLLLTIFTCVLCTLSFSYNEPTLHLANLLSVIVIFILGIVYILNSLFEKKFELSSYNLFCVVGGLTASVILFFGTLGFLINFLITKKEQNFFYFYFIILVIFSGIYLILSLIYLLKYLKKAHSKVI